MAEITGGELLLKCLHVEKVRFVHAITDGTYMMFLEALERLGDELGMRLIVPRHEAAAAHACDAYTRVTGDRPPLSWPVPGQVPPICWQVLCVPRPRAVP